MVKYKGAPKRGGGCRAATPPLKKKLQLEKQDFVDKKKMSDVLRDLASPDISQ